jgi:arabinan endo-1,5-alpha-L-arabinosidase
MYYSALTFGSQWPAIFLATSPAARPFTDRNGTVMTSGGGSQVPAAYGPVRGPGYQAVISDTTATC